MPNMSYCRFQNTLTDLRDCAGALEDMATGDKPERLSRTEFAAAVDLAQEAISLIRFLADHAGIDLDEQGGLEELEEQVESTLADIDEPAN